MTAPVPSPDADGLRSAARWWAALAVVLDEMVPQVGRLAVEIAHDWPDERGRELAERVAGLHRELRRDADAAADLGSSLLRSAGADQAGDAMGVAAAVRALGAARRSGVRLAGLSNERTDNERGMRIAELPDPGTAPG